MLTEKPYIKEVATFTPPKFAVMFGGEEGPLHDTEESAQYEADTMERVNNRLAKYFEAVL